MRKLLLYLFLLPFAANAQLMAVKDTTHGKKHKIRVEAFAEAAYLHELWIVSGNLKNGYSSLSYNGTGGFAGIGFSSKLDDKHRAGFGLSADYLGYIMDKSLSTNELTQTKFAFAKITPVFYLGVKTRSAFTFHWCATASMLVPMHARENNYYQLGLKGCVGYNAFVLDLGYSFGVGSSVPSTLLVTDHWREQMWFAALVFYPSRLEDWGKIKARIRHEFKH